MKVSISSWSYRYLFNKGEMNLVDFVDEVKRQQADGFEIFPAYVDQENSKKHLQEIVKKASDNDIYISSWIAGNDFALSSIEKRAAQVEMLKNKIRIAAEVGISKLNVFTGYHQDEQEPLMETMRVIDCFREVVPLAEEKDIVLCLENHSSVHPDADGLLSIIRAVGSLALRTNPDPTNFCSKHTQLDEKSREVIYKETRKVAPLMANAHLKINTFKENGFPEFVDVQRIIDIFNSVNYDGDIVLEYFGDGDPRSSIEKGVHCLKKLV